MADNGNNRIKIFRVDTGTGQLTLDDMLGRFRDDDGDVDHLKRPRGVRTDLDGNLYVADTYNGRILRFDNLADTTDSDPIRYRANQSSDAEAAWVYGRLGIHQVEMRAPTSAGTEDEAFQLPNDLVPVIRADGSFYRENIYSWGYYYSNARVHLVSDSGNNRIKKCWTNSSGTSLLRCSVSAGVGTVSDNEYWGHPRTLAGQLHSASGMAWLGSKNRLLVSDTPTPASTCTTAAAPIRAASRAPTSATASPASPPSTTPTSAKAWRCWWAPTPPCPGPTPATPACASTTRTATWRSCST
ncbi:hypothetical protein HML84_05360 [Alcanivorax sp. IO_7]|nr:hypothetical protein HML84_05360 [Alcanivorax sp. IO_7]